MLTYLMRRRTRRWIAWLMLGATGVSTLSGCSRQFWRRQADRDSYKAIGEKLNDPHWQVPRIELTPDSRSRFFDPYDPDKEPLPPDDPAAHEMMHCVNGRKGYKNWHKLGTSFAIENPQWLSPYGISMQGVDPVNGHAQVQLLKVNLPQAMDLATIHSREYQLAIEDLYLDALALTGERFKLGVRYLGTAGTEPGATLSTRSDASGNVSSTLGSAFGISQALPTGGQIAVDIANTATWMFGGGGGFSAPTLGYSLTQPLLFRAGRKIALEPLTQAERDVLYSARTLARFRQTLFTQVAALYLNLLQQRQSILNTINNIRQLEDQLIAQEARDSRVTGVASAVFDGQAAQLVIPPNLAAKLRTNENFLVWEGSMSPAEEEMLLAVSAEPEYQAAAQVLIGFKSQKTTTLSYLQLRDRLNGSQTQLAQSGRNFADTQDALKLLLGLPPNIVLEIEESALLPFELISPELMNLETAFRDMQVELGDELLPLRQEGVVAEPAPEFLGLKSYVTQLATLSDSLYEVGLTRVQNDFAEVNELLERTQEDWSIFADGERYFRSEEERNRLSDNIENNLRVYRFAERKFAIGQSTLEMLTSLMNAGAEEEFFNTLDKNQSGVIELVELPEGWGELPRKGNDPAAETYTLDDLLVEIASAARIIHDENLLRVSQGLEVVQVALRVELIAVNPFTLDGTMRIPDIEEVVNIGIENRHDLMNTRALVMDARRRVEIAANQLEAGLDVVFAGTQGLNPDARSRTNHSASLRFTTPLDQVIERNGYRTALVTYQRARRTYMEQEDRVKLAIRQSWRQIQTQEYRLEVDRTTVRNAALQYDSASLQAAGPNQTNALNLVGALNSVLTAQNSLVSDWVTYETNRLNIYRDMGIMELDPRGVWVDPFYQQMDSLPTNGDASLPANAPEVVLPVPEPQN